MIFNLKKITARIILIHTLKTFFKHTPFDGKLVLFIALATTTD